MTSKKSVKIKIIGLIIALTICILLIGISVYAALTQSLSIDNNITISTDGQTKVEVNVFEYSNSGNSAVDVLPNTIDFPVAATITKQASDDDISGNLTNIIFRSDGNINFYALKFSFANSSTVPVYAHISATAIDNLQIKVHFGESLTTLTELNNNIALQGQVELTVDQSKDFYLIISSSVDLVDLEYKEMLPFAITIFIDQTSL